MVIKLNYKCSKNVNCDVIFSGPGERISEEVKKFPKFNSIIFSSDTMSKKSSKETLKKIINNDINILVGTQLISKGFHFPNLNCIIVLDIDLSSMGHDLRSSEKIYNCIINYLEELEELENLQQYTFKHMISTQKQ